jgi:hypothetical protein
MTIQSVDRDDALKRLKLFNAKADELKGYSFIGKALHEGAGVQVNFDCVNKTMEANRTGADNEARAAMCLVLRFFVQQRDGIELHQMAELYQRLPVPDEDRRWVSENLSLVDKFLDRPTELALNGNPITYRAVLETFLYGEHAHANPDKRAVLETWKEIAPIYSVLENFFEFTVGEVLKYVYWLASMNRDAIRTLEQNEMAALT